MKNQNRAFYEEKFASYPDVLEYKDIREMLGGVSEHYLSPLLRNGTIKCFKMNNGRVYMIPKEYFIDFVVSDAYQDYKHKLKAQI
jgi:hypothetical protein